MSRSKKPASAPNRKSSISSEMRYRIALHLTIFVIFASGIVSLFRISQIYVDRRLAFPTLPPRVVLIDRPAWMSDFLAEEIIKSTQPLGLHSAFDKQLLVDTAKALASNPWIKRVIQVRRVFAQNPGDTLAIDCEYRVPAALVRWGTILLAGGFLRREASGTIHGRPIAQDPSGRRWKTNVRIIDGVAHAPSESGRVWSGEILPGDWRWPGWYRVWTGPIK